MEKEKRIEFLQKLKDLLAEYNASIFVENPGWDYDGHIVIYKDIFKGWEEIASFEDSDYNNCLLDAAMIEKEMEKKKRREERKR